MFLAFFAMGFYCAGFCEAAARRRSPLHPSQITIELKGLRVWYFTLTAPTIFEGSRSIEPARSEMSCAAEYSTPPIR